MLKVLATADIWPPQELAITGIGHCRHWPFQVALAISGAGHFRRWHCRIWPLKTLATAGVGHFRNWSNIGHFRNCHCRWLWPFQELAPAVPGPCRCSSLPLQLPEAPRAEPPFWAGSIPLIPLSQGCCPAGCELGVLGVLGVPPFPLLPHPCEGSEGLMPARPRSSPHPSQPRAGGSRAALIEMHLLHRAVL